MIKQSNEESNKKTNKYNKLVRDKIPEKIRRNGENPVVRVLNNKEYKEQLDIKLKEELEEYYKDDNVDELADLIEVVYAILDFKEVSLEEFEEIRTNKNDKRGRFTKRFFLEDVEEITSN